MTESLVTELDGARQHFLALVDDIRPELHRYCSRIVGSIVDGEDIVQDTLAKAFYAMSMASEIPPLRPWLFRIAHNTAIDHLRRYEHKHVDPRGDFDDASDAEPMDPAVTRAALASFLELPVIQRSAVILKDVLGHSVEEAAETMGTTVPAVKAALVRGRARMRQLRTEAATAITIDPAERARLANYVALFNARDWDALRAMIGDECRLDLVTRAERRGKQIHGYFGRYAAEPVHLEIGSIDGRPALLAHTKAGGGPSYFMLLDWDGDRLAAIRDYRYVPYLFQ
ncbi:MAG TPA: sigma-70 family RNA polymerase sigma factor [Kofleriaceae bacterium]|nr:sigma-70 family RNA polymerase sigma factor [Kofleriaceae bacterium]